MRIAAAVVLRVCVRVLDVHVLLLLLLLLVSLNQSIRIQVGVPLDELQYSPADKDVGLVRLPVVW